MSAMPLEVSALETGQATLWILLVAVNEYYDRRLPSLQYSVIDCQDLAQAFAQATQKFSTTTVRVHHDAAEFAPTVGTVRKSLAEIVENAQPQDTVLLYFCGHSGLESRFQQAVLCLADTEKDALLKTGLSLMSVLGQLGNCAATQQILWLDLFHGNGMALQDGVENPLPFDNPAWQLNEMLQRHTIEHPGFSAFLSCDAAQRTKGSQPQQSWKFPELGRSVFAHFLIEGLRGAAANGKDVIDAKTLEEYVSVQTQKFIDRANGDLRRLHDPDSKREGLLLSPKYLAQSPKRIGQSSACVLGLKLPDLLESTVPQVKRQDTIDEVIRVPVDSEPEPETLTLKTETPAPELVPSLKDIALSSLVVNELRDAIESEPETIPTDSEASPSPDTESRSQASPVVEVEETPVETPTEPVVEELIAEEPVAEFISKPVVEYGTEETFHQVDPEEEVSESASELDEPVSELVFEPVIGIAEEDSAQGEHASESVAEFVEPIPELISEPVIEDATADHFTQIEDETDATSELDESGDPVSELVFEPVIGIVAESSSVESAPELVAPISELISDPVIEYATADSLHQLEDETDATSELDESVEPGSELVFESVIGAVAQEDVSQLERSAELVSEPISESIESSDSVSEFISDPTLEYIPEDHSNQIDVAPELVSESESVEPVDPVSELVFEPVVGSVVEDESYRVEVEPAIAEPIAEQVETLEPISDLISDPVIEYGTEENSNPVEVVTEPGLDLTAELDELVEPVSELVFEPVVGTVLEDDLDRIESVTEDVGGSVDESVVEDRSEIITESINLDKDQLINNGTAYQPDLDDQPDLEDSEDDDFGLFVDSVHKAVGQSADSPVSRPIDESDSESSPSVDRSKTPQSSQMGRSLLENLQRSSRNVANAGQTIYQDRAPEIQNALTEIATRFDRSTRQLTQTTLESIRQPRTQKIAIAALGGVGIVAIGVTAFSLYQQRNAQLNSIQSLSANSAALLSSNRVTEAIIDALKAGQQLQQLDRPWNFVPESAKIATVAALQQAIAQSTIQTSLPLEAGLRNVTMSADAKTLAAVTSKQTIQLWQREDNQLKPLDIAFDASTEEHQSSITQLRFSPDGKILASASEDKTVKLWDTEKGTLIKTLTGHQDRVTAISFRSDGGVLATASHDRTIKLWGVPSGNVLDTLKGHDAEISVMTFSPDGRMLSAGSTANTIYLWFPDSNKPILLGRHQSTNPGSSAQGIRDLAFSADGKTIASASWNDAIKLWTVSDGKSDREASPRQTLKSQTSATSLSFSPDGKWLASGGQDGAIQLWDLQTSTAIKTLLGHQGTVQRVAFSPDGKALHSVGDRNGIILWDFNLTTLMKQGCNLAQNEIRSNFTLQNSNLCRSDS